MHDLGSRASGSDDQVTRVVEPQDSVSEDDVGLELQVQVSHVVDFLTLTDRLPDADLAGREDHVGEPIEVKEGHGPDCE